jgi:hypothetical protein
MVHLSTRQSSTETEKRSKLPFKTSRKTKMSSKKTRSIIRNDGSIPLFKKNRPSLLSRSVVSEDDDVSLLSSVDLNDKDMILSDDGVAVVSDDGYTDDGYTDDGYTAVAATDDDVLRLRGGGLANVSKSTNAVVINASSGTAAVTPAASAAATVVNDVAMMTKTTNVRVESLHLSCSSDAFSPSANYVGVIFYEKCRLAGHNIRPGYVVMKNVESSAFINISNKGKCFLLLSSLSPSPLCRW